MRRLIWSVIVVLAASPVAAQNTVKIGQIEAQTGANAIYGYMSSQGLALAVDQVNKAGGFKVGDKTYTVELMRDSSAALRLRFSDTSDVPTHGAPSTAGDQQASAAPKSPTPP